MQWIGPYHPGENPRTTATSPKKYGGENHIGIDKSFSRLFLTGASFRKTKQIEKFSGASPENPNQSQSVSGRRTEQCYQ